MRLGIRKFWLCNSILTLICAAALLLCAMADNAVFLGDDGYGFLQHPGIFGWFLIQLCMPPAIHRALSKAVSARRGYRSLAKESRGLEYRKLLYEPLLQFIGLRTERSRELYTILFTFGFLGFAWNTYNNIFPQDLPLPSFWDSIDYIYSYSGTRLYKFYMDALLLPSVIHIFAGIVWFHTSYLRSLVRRQAIRVLPFSPDRSGGMGFVADLILSSTITALLVSGLAFLGAVYTHRSFDTTVAIGTLVEVSVLISFYIAPTALIKKIIEKLKSIELTEIYACQQKHYDDLFRTGLSGKALKDAYEQSQYFSDVAGRIRSIPEWPHLAKVFGAFGLSITPGLIVSSISLVSHWTEVLLNQS
jgi:hypothetical protein